MNLVWVISFIGLAVAATLAVLRLVRGPSLAERIVALDFLIGTVVGGVAVYAVATSDTLFIDVLVVASLLSFVGSIIVARFIEEQGA